MAGLPSGNSSHHGAPEGHHKASHDKPEEGVGRWYFSRKEIEENSPSRKDGIDLKKEAYLRKSYCTFLQDLGIRLKVPQVTIATAIIFCHRFFLRQSHAKNDRRTIAIVCMFLAGKVEETPRPLKDVILVSYEIIHKKDAAAVQRIKQKDVYEQQKELILLGERIVLVTLGFDLNVLHPYKPLVDAIKSFKVAQNALAQVAWNFVNDGLRTSLCLQFKPHHIAAGAIFLAAKFLKVKLPHDVWEKEFGVAPYQLEEVSNQMLELYEQNKSLPSQASEAEGSAGNSQRPQSKGQPNDEHLAGSSQGGTVSKASLSKLEQPPKGDADKPLPNPSGPSSRASLTRNADRGSCDLNAVPDNREDDEMHGSKHQEHDSANRRLDTAVAVDGHQSADQKGDTGPSDMQHNGRVLPTKVGTPVGHSPQSANKKLDLEKVISLKAAMERRKAQGDIITHKTDPVDEIERELENVEMPVSKADRKQVPSEDTHHRGNNIVEEGELEVFDDDQTTAVGGYHHESRKRKPDSSEYAHGVPKQSGNRAYDDDDDRKAMGRHEYQEREHKRRLQENHV